MRVLVTGANGFLGRNLLQHLAEREDVEVLTFTRNDPPALLNTLVDRVDFVFHLAGVTRPRSESEFAVGNVSLTQTLCDAIVKTGRVVPVLYASSIQAEKNNPYGLSKRMAEDSLIELQEVFASPTYIFRLPNVFGKWSRPNHNSVIATFCHNIAHDLPILVHDPDAKLSLAYIDDVIAAFLDVQDGRDCARDGNGFCIVEPLYATTVGVIAAHIHSFKESRNTLVTERVGEKLMRALYSTYISYLSTGMFSYPVPMHGDARGVFVEMLKTPDCGQFSYFTAHPGVTRGGHYHHTKTEKFLVVKGRAKFKFKNILTNETHELVVSGDKAEIVETVPGWVHDITNIGNEEMVVMLWANEVFDRQKPDTYTRSL